MSSFYVLYMYYVPGTVRESLDIIIWVSQKPYEQRECISENLSNLPKQKQFTGAESPFEPISVFQGLDIFQYVTKLSWKLHNQSNLNNEAKSTIYVFTLTSLVFFFTIYN